RLPRHRTRSRLRFRLPFLRPADRRARRPRHRLHALHAHPLLEPPSQQVEAVREATLRTRRRTLVRRPRRARFHRGPTRSLSPGRDRGLSPRSSPASDPPVQFRKALRIQDLILFGVICVTPTAPIPWFGILQKLSQGQAATTIAFAMLAMLPTAFSYGRMAARYPATGSAYTYVARGLHPHLGFLAGWATLLDYFLIPITGVIYCAVTMHRVVPAIPYLVWAVFFGSLSTVLNLRGIRTGVRTQQLLLVLMTAVIVAVIALAVQYLWGQQGLQSLVSIAPF